MENADAVKTSFNVVMRPLRVCVDSVPNIFQYKLNRCHGKLEITTSQLGFLALQFSRYLNRLDLNFMEVLFQSFESVN